MAASSVLEVQVSLFFSILGSILLWILGIALGLVLLLLVVPLHLQADGFVGEDDLEGRVLARWGWWVLTFRADSGTGVDARVFGLRVWRYERRPDKPKREKKKKDKPKKTRRQKAEKGGRFWQNRQAMARFASTLLRAIPVRGVGLDDPADTAALFGVLDRLGDWSEAIELDVEPNWIDETVEVGGAISVRLWPAHVLLALLWLLISDGETRRGVRAAWWTS